jgi:hypothetical protein
MDYHSAAATADVYIVVKSLKALVDRGERLTFLQ